MVTLRPSRPKSPVKWPHAAPTSKGPGSFCAHVARGNTQSEARTIHLVTNFIRKILHRGKLNVGRQQIALIAVAHQANRRSTALQRLEDLLGKACTAISNRRSKPHKRGTRGNQPRVSLAQQRLRNVLDAAAGWHPPECHAGAPNAPARFRRACSLVRACSPGLTRFQEAPRLRTPRRRR